LLNFLEKLRTPIGITTGDPAGIGPEVALRAALDPALREGSQPILFGDSEVLRSQAGALGLEFDFEVLSLYELLAGRTLPAAGIVDVHADRKNIRPGIGSRAGGEAAARNVVACVEACLRGRLKAMCTAPLNKKYLNEAGYPYPGHTELLAYLCQAPSVAMAFLTEKLKIVLVTIHIPLAKVIESINRESILEKLEITLREFPRLGLPCRRVAVAGLNPHAGEEGLLGTDEIDRIEPAIREARRRWPQAVIDGPIPADTLFYRAAQGEFDVVLSLYHDQGLAPIKLLGFGEAVNVTLGLPFVRTSVDHGTAFDIAGRGVARPESMISAVRWALRLTRPD